MRARDNPYRVERLHALEFRFAGGDDFARLLSRLHARGGRGSIVGPHGSGKTTLTEQLREHLAGDGYRVRAVRIGGRRHTLTLDDWERIAPDDLGPGDAVLLDGAGHLWPWSWWRFRFATRRAAIVVTTAHRRGRFAAIFLTRPSPELLLELTSSLAAPIDPRAANALYQRSRGNLRDALRALYDAHG